MKRSPGAIRVLPVQDAIVLNLYVLLAYASPCPFRSPSSRPYAKHLLLESDDKVGTDGGTQMEAGRGRSSFIQRSIELLIVTADGHIEATGRYGYFVTSLFLRAVHRCYSENDD